MAAPFSVESSVPGVPIWTVDASGNTSQSGTINGTAAVISTITTVGVQTQSGVNTAAGAVVLTSGSIGAGTNPLLGTAASGTQLADLTRDYMVYIGVTAGGAAATWSIGPTSAAANTIFAAATCNVGTTYTFRVPAGWFVRFQGTAGITQQSAISC